MTRRRSAIAGTVLAAGTIAVLLVLFLRRPPAPPPADPEGVSAPLSAARRVPEPAAPAPIEEAVEPPQAAGTPEPRREIAGCVADRQGAPIPDARVALRKDLEWVEAARAGQDGCFRIGGLKEGVHRLKVSAEAHAAMVIDHVPAGIEDLEIRLEPEAAIAGQLLQPDGTPAGGVKVTLRYYMRDPPPFPDTSVASEDGSFEFHPLPEGTFRLEAYHPLLGQWKDRVVLVPGQRKDVGKVVLEEQFTVLFRAVDQATGQPVGGVKLAIGPREGVTDPDGLLLLTNVPEQEHGSISGSVPFSRTFFPTISSRHYLIERVSQVVGEKEIQVSLIRGGAIRGRVVDPLDRPLPGVAVSPGGYEPKALTDDRGEFLMEPLEPGTSKLVATAAGYGRAEADGVAVEAGKTAEVRLVLRPGGAVAGRVLVVEAPAGEARVAAEIGELIFRAESGEDGRFLIRDLPPGTFSLEASLPGLRLAEVQDIRVEPGRTADAGDIALVEGAEVSGRIVDPAGLPVAAAWVTIDFQDQHVARVEATSDAGGRFFLRGPPGLRGTMSLRRPGFEWKHSLPVTAPATDLVLTLRPYAWILGRVVDGESGAPVPFAEVKAYDPRAALSAATTSDAVGRFAVGVFDGDHDVRAQAAGYAESLPAGTVTPGRGPVQVRLLAGTEVVLRVVDPQGRPAGHAAVRRVTPGSGVSDRLGSSGKDGLVRCRFRDGSHRVLVFHHELAIGEFEIQVPGDGEPLLALEAPGALRVSVMNPDGSTVRPVKVEVLDERGNDFKKLTGFVPRVIRFGDEGGRGNMADPDALHHLPPGRYRVRAAAGERTAEAEVEVTTGAEAEVVLTLP